MTFTMEEELYNNTNFLDITISKTDQKISFNIHPLKYESISVSFKDPFRTAQKTLSASVLKTDKLMLCTEIIAVCSEIHAKHINALWAEHRISEC